MKKRTSRIARVALALVLCMSLMPVMAMAVELIPPSTAAGQRQPGTESRYNVFVPINKEDPSARRPFDFGRENVPAEPEKEPEKQLEEQLEKEPEKRYEDIDSTVTSRYIKIMESGKGFEELWSNRESPLWTLGDIQQYLARRGMRIPTAGVDSAAHR